MHFYRFPPFDWAMPGVLIGRCAGSGFVFAVVSVGMGGTIIRCSSALAFGVMSSPADGVWTWLFRNTRQLIDQRYLGEVIQLTLSFQSRTPLDINDINMKAEKAEKTIRHHAANMQKRSSYQCVDWSTLLAFKVHGRLSPT